MTAGAYSIPEVQRLVATLVASKPGGRIAELGNLLRRRREGDRRRAARGAPRSSPWSSIPTAPHGRAQRSPGRAAEVLEGDWRELLPARGPFDVLFADGGGSYGDVADLLSPGGILVKDDLTPGRPVAGDATREALLLDPRLEATEIRVTADMACIVAVRRSDLNPRTSFELRSNVVCPTIESDSSQTSAARRGRRSGTRGRLFYCRESETHACAANPLGVYESNRAVTVTALFRCTSLCQT